MAFERPGGWVSVTNFGDDAANPCRRAGSSSPASRWPATSCRPRRPCGCTPARPAGERGPAHLRRAAAGRDLRGPAGRRPARRRSAASRRSSAPTTTSRWATSTGLPGPTDSWVTLAGLARETSTIRLGTLVTSATFRHPGPLAISVAQVDQMSGGRVELGLGAGWFEAEHRAYGLEFPDVRTRFDRFEEQLAVITGLWRTPSARRSPTPVSTTRSSTHRPCPSRSPRTGRRSSSAGQGKRRTPRAGRQVRRRVQRRASRPSTTPAPASTRVGRRARRSVATPDSLVRSAALTVCCGRDDAEVRRRAEASRARPRRAARRRGIAGTPAECVEAIGRYAAGGRPAHLPAGARPRRPRPPRPRRRRGHAPGVGPPERVRARLRRSRRVPPKVTFGAYRCSRGHFWLWTVIRASKGDLSASTQPPKVIFGAARRGLEAYGLGMPRWVRGAGFEGVAHDDELGVGLGQLGLGRRPRDDAAPRIQPDAGRVVVVEPAAAQGDAPLAVAGRVHPATGPAYRPRSMPSISSMSATAASRGGAPDRGRRVQRRRPARARWRCRS